MKSRRLQTLSLTALFPLLLLAGWLLATTKPLLSSAPLSPTSKITPALHAQIETAPESLRFIVYFDSPSPLELDTLPQDETARRAALVNQLQKTAAASQRSVIQQLDQFKTRSLVSHYRELWIINAIAVEARPEIIEQIASDPSVQRIVLDTPVATIEPAATITNGLQIVTADFPNWGIAASRANHTWDALQVRGEGVTVAIMDTGVDWQHPDLASNYRGQQPGGGVQHEGHWYHAAVPTETTPVDYIWHGTHVAGTAVGQNGIGVAPNAQWIAVSIADQQGVLFASYIHAGFQWLLAPAGDPALAPDVVNNSWGGSGISKEFLPDIELLLAADIIPVFASGNNGPEESTITFPASYTDTIAVGAYDPLDTLTWFSSRGPSFFTSQTKPLITAPGAQIYSAYLNGEYALANGTSMAAPHVSGAIALMLSADPTLTLSDIRQTLANTAAPFPATPHPNPDSGWGKLDVYAAVRPHAASGTLTGLVSDSEAPLNAADLTLIPPNGRELSFTASAAGQFALSLSPATYTLRITKFGYEPLTLNNIQINEGDTTVRNATLTKQATGTFQGQISDPKGTISATIELLDTPVTLHTTADGQYSTELPAGSYTARISAKGHRQIQRTVTINPNATTTKNYFLETTDSILLVDSAQWYYRSQISSYQAALDSLRYSYDLWSIHTSYDDLPPLELLASYDIVIWSSPEFGPAYMNAHTLLSHYLDTGGNLFISGHDVGLYDNYAWNGGPNWWRTRLRAVYQQETDASNTFTGAAGTPFADMTLTLNGTDSAQNQTNIDISAPRLYAPYTKPLFTTTINGREEAAGLTAGQCDPYDIVYLGFGLEGVTGASQRTALTQRAIEQLNRPKTAVDIRWGHDDIFDLIVPDSQLHYALPLFNGSEFFTETVQIKAETNGWNVDVPTPTLTLPPCTNGLVPVTVDIPADVPLDTIHQIRFTATSSQDPAVSDQLLLEHKTPAPLLIVDDHRWYDEKINRVSQILDEQGIVHDIWTINDLDPERGSPPADLLQQYEFVLWFTAYDWFDPVTSQELATIEAYIESGGRFFLSSQDFLYYHHHSAVAQAQLGITHYQESITPTVAYPAYSFDLPPISTTVPISLVYPPYKNNSDGLIPRPGTQIQLLHNRGIGALGHQGLSAAGEPWRTAFWATPLEIIAPAVLTHTVNNMLGWLGDLGSSTFTVDQAITPAGTARTYTLTLHNSATTPNQVTITNTLPPNLNLLPATIQGGGTYDPAARQLRWTGELDGRQTHTISYQAETPLILPAGTEINNHAVISYAKHDVTLSRSAAVWVNTPDFSTSHISLTHDAPYAYTTTVSYLYTLTNSGLIPAENASAVFHLPYFTHLLTDTLRVSAGTAALAADQQLHWQGDLPPNQSITLSLQMTTTQKPVNDYLITIIEFDDGVSNNLHTIHHQAILPPYRYHFPFMYRQE